MSPWRPLRGDPAGEGPGPRPVADALPRLLASLRAPAPAVLDAVFTRWEDIVGPAIADHAWPLKIQDGVLHLGVEQPAWASQLAFLGPQLVRKVVAATGDDTVKKIELKVVARRPK